MIFKFFLIFYFLLSTLFIYSGEDSLKLKVLPIPVSSKKSLKDMKNRPHVIISEDWFNWGGNGMKGKDNEYYIFNSRFPKSIGFYSWISHSEIVYRLSKSPVGPFEFKNTALHSSGKNRKGWFTAHNPKIKKFGDTYYLYFIQTKIKDVFQKDTNFEEIRKKVSSVGNKSFRPKARSNQRIFAATSSSINGPWKISEKPIIEPAKVITTLTVNPAVAEGPDGKYYMILKGDKPNSRQRNQALAIAPTPLGPWVIQDKPVIDNMDTEDASIWYDKIRNRFYAVFHAHRYIGMITSKDGINWKKACQYKILSNKKIPFDDGSILKFPRLERPFMLTDENGTPEALYVSVLSRGKFSATFAFSVKVLDYN